MKLPAVVKGPCPPALTPQETCWAPHLSFHLFPVGGDPLPWAPSPLSLRDVLCLDPQDPACTGSLCLSDLSRTSALPRSLPLVLQIQRALLPQALCTCPSPRLKAPPTLHSGASSDHPSGTHSQSLYVLAWLYVLPVCTYTDVSLGSRQGPVHVCHWVPVPGRRPARGRSPALSLRGGISASTNRQ